MQKYLDVVLHSLRQTLKEHGVSEILELQRGTMRVCPERFDCDMYRFFAGDVEAINSYRGEYMNAYAWARYQEAWIGRKV